MSAKILIIDDEESIRFTLANFLSKEGHKVLTARDYSTATAIIANESLDLIFADIVLGDRSGVDILRAAKNRGLTCPIVMITGYPNIETASRAVRLGAFDYLPKPIRKDQILRTTVTALNYKHALDQKAFVETKQKKYKRHLEAIFQSINHGIVTVDRNMRITSANEAVREICGIDSQAASGRQFGDVFCHCEKRCLDVLQRILKHEKIDRDQQIRCGCRHRPDQTVLLTGVELRDKEGYFLGAVLVFKDIRLSQ